MRTLSPSPRPNPELSLRRLPPLPRALSPRERCTWILINVLAIIFVVALHVRFNYRVDYDSPGWVLENILSGTAVAAVPLFFMASGITLLNFTNRESVGTFYKKRFTKILIPLLV